MKLYELADEYVLAMRQMEDADIDEQTMRDTLDGIKGEITNKITNIGKIIKNYQANIEVIAGELDRLGGKKKTLENKIFSLKTYLQTEMDKLSMDRVSDPILTVSYTENAPSVNLVDLTRVPGIYWKEQDPILDKQRILQELKEGVEIDGVTLQRTKSIKIR